MSTISCIIVNYNQPDHLQECLRALEPAFGNALTETVVVDNASHDPDRAREICAAYGGQVQFIGNQVNMGLAGAANLALSRTTGDYAFNLNPDVRASREAALELARLLDRNPRAGVAFPRLLNPDGSLQRSCRTHYDFITVLLRRIPLGKWYNGPRIRKHLMADWDHNALREIDWALGAAFMARRSALPQGRLFDDRYFLYMEDVDLCLTLRQNGWGIYYVPTAVMIHHHLRASRKKTISRANWEHLKSYLNFLMKHGGRVGQSKFRAARLPR